MNPPHSIYKEDISPGQAAYHIWLDAMTRDLTSQGKRVFFPSFSLNVFGKKAEDIDLHKDPIENGRSRLEHYLQIFRTRDYLHLSSDEVVRDNSQDSKETVYSLLDELRSQGVLDTNAILDLSNITEENISQSIQGSSFSSRPLEKKVSNLFKKLIPGKRIEIKTDSKNALPYSSYRVKPIFSIANMWSSDIKTKMIMPFSPNTIGNYVLSQVSPHLALDRGLGVDLFYQFPKLELGEDVNFEQNLGDEDWMDCFRFAVLISHSLKQDRVILSSDSILRGSKFQSKLTNLNKLFDSEEFHSRLLPPKSPGFNFRSQTESLERDVWEFSRKISRTKSQGAFEDTKRELSSEFSDLLIRSKAIMPHTVSKMRS